MKTRTTFLGTILALAIASCTKDSRNSADVLSDTLNLSSNYRPRKFIAVINHLRSLGKEKALDSLRDYASNGHESDWNRAFDIWIICRCLFVEPKGWGPLIGLGSPWPRVRPDYGDKFPQFPIVFVREIPFILEDGYSGGGNWANMSPEFAIKRCESLALISQNLPEFDPTTAAAAAKELIASKAFQTLYENEDGRAEAEQFILIQAEKSAPSSSAK